MKMFDAKAVRIKCRPTLSSVCNENMKQFVHFIRVGL